MEKKDNVLELKVLKNGSFEKKEQVFAQKFSTNPISKNFIKFINSHKNKFDIKDLFR